MIGLTKRTDYALIAIAHLSEHRDGGSVRARDIAERFAIPSELLAKILQKLAKAGVLTSSPGPTGGYALGVPVEDLTVGAVLAAVEGSPALAQCLRTADSTCEQLDRCNIRGPLARINAGVLRMLNSIPVSELSSGGDRVDIGVGDIEGLANRSRRRAGGATPEEQVKSI